MKRSKKIFLIFSFIFFISLIYLGYDISRKTRFPGSDSVEEKSGKSNYQVDSVKTHETSELENDITQKGEEEEN